MDVRLLAPGTRGRIRLLTGMVRDNRPWRLIPNLTSVLGAALAAAAFGLFFSTVWTLADAQPPWRLGLVTVLALTVLVGWLVTHNDLWEKPLGGSRGKFVLYNAAAVLTVTLGSLFAYAMLFSIMFLGAGVVIPVDYLQSTLGHPVGVGDYAALAWLSSSMGTVAGALGSGLESAESVRNATFSGREQQRRAREEHETG